MKTLWSVTDLLFFPYCLFITTLDPLMYTLSRHYKKKGYLHIIFVAYCWSWLEAIWYTYLYLLYNMLSTINYQTLFFLTSLFYRTSAQILAVLCLYDTFNFNFSLDPLCMCFLKNSNLSCPIHHSRIFMSCFHTHTHTHTLPWK